MFSLYLSPRTIIITYMLVFSTKELWIDLVVIEIHKSCNSFDKLRLSPGTLRYCMIYKEIWITTFWSSRKNIIKTKLSHNIVGINLVFQHKMLCSAIVWFFLENKIPSLESFFNFLGIKANAILIIKIKLIFNEFICVFILFFVYF